MAFSRIEPFEVTIPAGTLSTAPQVTALDFDPGVVDEVEILIPPGPSGLVGFQLRHSGEGVLPREDTRFVVADGEVIHWPLENVPETRGWALRAYNRDVHPHTLYLRFQVGETRRIQSTVATALVIEQPDQVAPQAESPTPDLEYADSGVT